MSTPKIGAIHPLRATPQTARPKQISKISINLSLRVSSKTI